MEFVADEQVIAREVGEILQGHDLPAIGASSLPVRGGTRADILKGGEFLRISVKRDRERFLIYMPGVPCARSRSALVVWALTRLSGRTV